MFGLTLPSKVELEKCRYEIKLAKVVYCISFKKKFTNKKKLIVVAHPNFDKFNFTNNLLLLSFCKALEATTKLNSKLEGLDT